MAYISEASPSIYPPNRDTLQETDHKFKAMYLERTRLLQIDLLKQQLTIPECAESTGGMATDQIFLISKFRFQHDVYPIILPTTKIEKGMGHLP